MNYLNTIIVVFFLVSQVALANTKKQQVANLPCVPKVIAEKVGLNLCFGDSKKVIKKKIPDFRYERSTNEFVSNSISNGLFYGFLYSFEKNRLCKVSFGIGTSYAFENLSDLQKGIFEIVNVINAIKKDGKLDPNIPGEYTFTDDNIKYNVHITKCDKPIFTYNIIIAMTMIGVD